MPIICFFGMAVVHAPGNHLVVCQPIEPNNIAHITPVCKFVSCVLLLAKRRICLHGG